MKRLTDPEKPDKISILTDPIHWREWAVREYILDAVRYVKNYFRPPRFNYGIYRGHYAVTRSLVEGLKKLDEPFVYNPPSVEALTSTVIVLAGVRTLRQAIQLKRNGIIARIFAGPNVVVFSSDAGSIIASSEVDGVITPSETVSDLYIKENPSLMEKCIVWPAGVDVHYFKPKNKLERRQILIYEKQSAGYVGPIQPYAHYLRARGYPIKIIKYGCYTHEQFLSELQKSCLLVGFVKTESQGIAWAEAWSTDVPTLIWSNEFGEYRGREYRGCTAPYLDRRNGLFFKDLNEFKEMLALWEEDPRQFSPRSWVLEHMSDEVCARKLLEKIGAQKSNGL